MRNQFIFMPAAVVEADATPYPRRRPKNPRAASLLAPIDAGRVVDCRMLRVLIPF